MEEVDGSNPSRSTIPTPCITRHLLPRVAMTAPTIILPEVQRRSTHGPKLVFNRLTRGMDRTAYHPRPISLITYPVGMHGMDGKRFEVCCPAGRHFSFSRDWDTYPGHHGTCGWWAFLGLRRSPPGTVGAAAPAEVAVVIGDFGATSTSMSLVLSVSGVRSGTTPSLVQPSVTSAAQS
jgi:hypothetical protein